MFSLSIGYFMSWISLFCVRIYALHGSETEQNGSTSRVSTFRENLEMSGNLTAVREMSEN